MDAGLSVCVTSDVIDILLIRYALEKHLSRRICKNAHKIASRAERKISRKKTFFFASPLQI